MSSERADNSILREVMAVFQSALVTFEATINQLNVFPVPDGDTGTNMRCTIDTVLATLQESGESPAEVGAAIAKGSLLGARGNSGIILAQLLRALTQALSGIQDFGAAEFVLALQRADEAARAAVGEPTEGTMLSVATASSVAASANFDRGGDLESVARASYLAAVDALWLTPTQLPILERAGVVDAGGAGLTLLFGAFVNVITKSSAALELSLPESVLKTLSVGSGGPLVRDPVQVGKPRSYEVMFLLEATAASIIDFRSAWLEIGDSMVIVGEEPIWNCHLHTSEIGRAIEIGIEAGRPYEIRVTDLDQQVAEEGWVRSLLTNEVDKRAESSPPHVEGEHMLCAVVAVSNGEGLREILESLGVGVIVEGGQSMNPSTQEILAAIDRVDADQIVILPNDKNILAVARAAAMLRTVHIEVLETANIPEAISVMLHFDPHRGASENVNSMRKYRDLVATGQVTQAVRDAVIGENTIAQGDFLAFDQSGIVAVGSDLSRTTVQLVEALLREAFEIATLYSGIGVQEKVIEEIVESLSSSHPRLVVEHFVGGQPNAPMMVALE